MELEVLISSIFCYISAVMYHRNGCIIKLCHLVDMDPRRAGFHLYILCSLWWLPIVAPIFIIILQNWLEGIFYLLCVLRCNMFSSSLDLQNYYMGFYFISWPIVHLMIKIVFIFSFTTTSKVCNFVQIIIVWYKVKKIWYALPLSLHHFVY